MVTVVGNQTAGTIAEHLARSSAPQDGPALSALAEQALAGLARMQADFGAGATPVAAPGSAPSAPALVPSAGPADATTPPVPDDAAMLQEMTTAIENSTRVQAQLAKFMITASISTTMGSNLNTFLKGQ